MHIALIRRKYDLSGGAELSLRMLARAFLSQGHKVSVLAQSWQGRAPEGMELCAISAGNSAAAFAGQALQALERLRPDVALSLDRVPGAPYFRAGDGCHRAWLAHRAGYENVVKRLSFRFNPRHRVLLELEERLFKSPDLKLVIANSRMVAEEISRYYQLPQEKITVIYNPVDIGRLQDAYDQAALQQATVELKLAASDKILLFLGSGFERKGLAFIIKALARLPKEVKLLVAGQGSTRLYHKLAARMNVKERVTFLGLYEKPGILLGLCQALVLPTIYDPCANVCLEALAVGKPVVTTSNNGAKEFIEQGVNGWVLSEPAAADALATACAQALALKQPLSARLNSPDEWLKQMNQALGIAL